jgi:hypothetical protein
MVLAAACKGDPVKCEKAIRNYTALVFWDGANKEIEAKPEAERAAARKAALGKFETDLANGVDTLTSQCVSAGNDDQVQCMIDAKTAEDAKACTD